MSYVITYPENLMNLCIKNGWFTRGSNAQYEKLFEANQTATFTKREIALIIWLCSDDSLESILKKLYEARVEYAAGLFLKHTRREQEEEV